MFVSVIFLLAISCAISEKPCSDIFRYENNEFGAVRGTMVFKNDWTGSYEVELNMTVAAFVNQNIGIKRITPLEVVQNGGDIVYNVSFPVTNYAPEVTSVTFNSRVLCLNEPRPSAEYTRLTAYDFFSLPMNARKVPALLNFTLPHTKSTETTHPSETTHATPPTETTRSFINSTRNTVERTTEAIVFQNRNFEKFECGMAEDTQALIFRGLPTYEGQYPWLVAMFHLKENGEYKFICAGNLITNKHVISAAHCIRMDGYEAKVEDLILVLGKHNIKSWAVRSEIRYIETIYIHPDYVKVSDADISILVMYKTVDFTKKIKPVCLWHDEGENIVGDEGLVVGWGRTEFSNEPVTEPRMLTMPVVSQDDCLRAHALFLNLISNRTFCAGTRKGSGTCSGDSGGGFIMKRNGRWTLRGIVSSGLGNSITRKCDVNYYMVFSDVLKFKLWIELVLTK